jgi:hypothetical protein
MLTVKMNGKTKFERNLLKILSLYIAIEKLNLPFLIY